jgi:hypothetical protein
LSVAPDSGSIRSVMSDRVRTGLRVGGLAGATTAGVLVGLGLRHGRALEPFFVQGRAFLSMIGGQFPPSVLAVGVGIVVHFVWMFLWGVCFSIVATELRGGALVGAGVLFVVLIGALASTIVPGALGAAGMALLSTPQTILLLILLGGALIAGVRVMRPSA